jgi:hypothetical protein
MRFVRLAVRSLAVLAYAIWVGGFTFYGAVVLWVVHDAYGSLEAGQITQKVTDTLNLIGVGTLLVWTVMGWLERHARPRWARNALYGLLLTSALLQIFLFVDHRILDERLATHGLEGFYAYHSVYLNASTVQWVVHLLMVPLSLWLCAGAPASASLPRDDEQ